MEVKLATSSERQVWINDYLTEYLRESAFLPYMGKGKNSIFRVRSELQNEAGKIINIPIIGRQKGSGVSGAQLLEGNEDDLDNWNTQVSIEWQRKAVVVPKSTSYLTEIDLLNAARDGLKEWSAERLRDSLIDALGQVVIPGSTSDDPDTVVSYASATSSQLNAYLAKNDDRVLFGATKTNNSSNNWANSLANIDATADKMSSAIGSAAKRMAKMAGGISATDTNARTRITPFKTADGREYYVMFTNPWAFRDLKTDTVISNANREARAREGNGMDKNPIFQDGDVIYDGVIYREVPELAQLTIAGADANSKDVAQNFLCGQTAVGIAWGQQPTPRTRTFDYGFRSGVGIEELRGQRKTSVTGTQFGMVSVLTSGIAD